MPSIIDMWIDSLSQMMREDAGVNIAASWSVTNWLFLLKENSQVVFTSSEAVLLSFKLAHLRIGSMDSPLSTDQL